MVRLRLDREEQQLKERLKNIEKPRRTPGPRVGTMRGIQGFPRVLKTLQRSPETPEDKKANEVIRLASHTQQKKPTIDGRSKSTSWKWPFASGLGRRKPSIVSCTGTNSRIASRITVMTKA